MIDGASASDCIRGCGELPKQVGLPIPLVTMTWNPQAEGPWEDGHIPRIPRFYFDPKNFTCSFDVALRMGGETGGYSLSVVHCCLSADFVKKSSCTQHMAHQQGK